ncbi:hypothetical protein RFI_34009 [Reticulomyxa filosa]|uniref:PH domain-containing protein n=1 Tax=Reticulomyxa filosa TaxID=46433 RepID=X6LPW9_RETFI|nr:hypothetical protein RFI_34009 [Reticulomyxa filosa]|eukprot:ETO03401.1 hypothetical protein RFI_34009 [Reticulomyxa filosa]
MANLEVADIVRFDCPKITSILSGFHKKKEKANTKIPISSIVEIRIDVVRLVKDQYIYETSFTAIYGDERNQLNVATKFPQEAYLWAYGLKILSDAVKLGLLHICKGSEIATHSLDIQNDGPSTHERANSVLILTDHSGINVFNKNNNTAVLEALAKRHTQ